MSKSKKEINLVISNDHKTIYCDHLFRFALGPTVSKLDFGTLVEHEELNHEVPEITTTLIIPTLNLLDVLPLIIEQSKTEEVRAEMLNKLNKIIEKFEKND